MSYTYPDEPIYHVAEKLFRSYIEDGTIEVGGKSTPEILDEYMVIMQSYVDSNTQIIHIPDHRADLFQRAHDEAINGDPNIAVTFCALWIEHTVNGSLIAALEIQGYESEEVVALIRDANFRNKVTVLWRLASLIPLEEDLIRLADQIMQARNAFVHYKWRARDDADYESEKSRLRDVVGRSRDLNAAFERANNLLHWNGREDEIIAAYRQNVIQHIAEVGPFAWQAPPPEESASNPSPSS